MLDTYILRINNMVKKIKSLKQIKKQIGIQKAKIAREKTRMQLEDDRMEAERELKILTRSASTKRNIVLIKRTGRGLKIITKAGIKIAGRQIKRIKEQQLRDDALARRIEKTRRRASSSIKKTRGSAKKIRRNLPGQIIADLDF